MSLYDNTSLTNIIAGTPQVTGSFVRASLGPFNFKEGTKITVRAQFTAWCRVYELT